MKLFIFRIHLYIILLILMSCKGMRKHDGGFSLVHEADSLYYVQLETEGFSDRWQLPYPVYQFATADVDGDGIIDALVGVVKPTRFDPTTDNRIFIFKNASGHVRPLWLGSRLGQPLIDFTVVKIDGETRIRSLESEQSGKFLVAEYRWKSFGLEFIHYLCREKEANEAKHIFND